MWQISIKSVTIKLKEIVKEIYNMANAYVIDSDSIKLPKEISKKLKLKEGRNGIKGFIR